MTVSNGNMPAMPMVMEKDEYVWCEGLTKRELFAMAAMQGILSGYRGEDISHGGVAWDAIKCADALLAELDKTGGE